MPRCSTRTRPVSAAAQSQARARDRTLPRVAGLPIAVGRGAGALCITPARPHRPLQPLRQRRRGPSWELWFRPSPHSPRRRAADYNSRQASRRPREPERWGVSAVSAGGLGRDAAAGWPGWRLLSSRGPAGRPPRVPRPFDWPAGWLTDSALLRFPEPPRPAGGSQTSGVAWLRACAEVSASPQVSRRQGCSLTGSARAARGLDGWTEPIGEISTGARQTSVGTSGTGDQAA
ncbi:mindbomb E3 ubiquitin protein ligase 2 [Rhinolophus ferrumequinum]|uniref:Mindbomb E3 ubiquitin protein ligase 2 n=1 Tax=Rhinolophus ferrumequinum TaxID=59479 RepID=A0A7J7X5X4_RHIFE|nr:mindbomb E3 ubiquitin protein ligase 2 [Rhinolophus ferrumequinum]